ncbi:unnamed protein product [Clonostachys rosea]|uniref:C2H2-type domain-containing protein n=1 Tax=Bionectria ochroleuca TaxID=29856 RepID=A0ABY6U6B5_BIOOC|nr:unnamed protein product [Clonostachys rosea]
MPNQTIPTSQSSSPGRQRRKVGLFEIDSEGKFTVCETRSGAQIDGRSATSSVCAEIHSTPDKNPVLGDDDIYYDPRGEGISDAPNIGVLLTGSWHEIERHKHCFPWRVGPVTREEVDQKLAPLKYHESLALSHGRQSKLGNVASAYAAGSTDYSVPDMTEASSRETDSICLPDHEIHQTDKHARNPANEASPDETYAGYKPDWTLILGMFDGHGKFKDQNSQFRQSPLLSHLDSGELPAAWTEKTQQHRNASYEDLYFTPIPGTTSEHDTSSASDAEHSESDSVWMSDYSESVPALQDGHAFLEIKPKILNEALRLFEFYSNYTKEKDTLHASSVVDAEEDKSSSQAPGGSSSIGPSSLSSGSKRAWDGTSQNGRKDGDDQNGEDERGPPRKRVRASKQSASRQASLACPYAKKDPIKYRSCYSYNLKRTQDVKQHLSRCHQLPIYCSRCKRIFQSEDERNGHIEVDISAMCPVRNIAYDGITREQKELLTRRVSHGMTLEDQWFSIFDILFPNHHPRPRSAYVNMDLTIDLEVFQDMMIAEGPKIITSTLASHNVALASISNPEHDLSSFYEILLAEGLQEIAHRWTAKLLGNWNAGEAADGDDSNASAASHLQPSTNHSSSSSVTLVTNKPSTRQPGLQLNDVQQESETTTLSHIRADVPDRATDDGILPIGNRLQQSKQPRMPIELPSNEFQPNLPTERHDFFSHPENISDLFGSQDPMLLDGLPENYGGFESWDNIMFDDEIREPTINKTDMHPAPAYRDRETPL